ncbi:MAG TPA: type II toxin-antitoxin system RelE/ParE family toxin [Methylomirabilota bacterium]|nr:type II toxin-antitoxin system RelE/ParE family toxin [Methylomirabilota bacterium]
MPRRILVRPQAEADLSHAFAWYQDRRPGLGHEFLSEIDRCFERIAAHPSAHPTVHGRYRCALTRRFPFKVFYVEEPQYVSVVAVLHGARHPGQWRSRLRGRRT